MDLSISHTAKTTYMTCPRKYFYSYIEGVVPKGTPAPLRMGSVFSSALEYWDEWMVTKAYTDLIFNEDNPYQRQKLCHERDVVITLVRQYMAKYPRHDREYEIPEILIGECSFKGFIDGRLDDLTLVENKLLSQWPQSREDALPLNDQVVGYVAAYSKIMDVPADQIRVRYHVTRKPGLRQRKDEDFITFTARCVEDILKREDHYQIDVPVQVTQATVDEWWEDTNDVARAMVASASTGVWPKNTGACTLYGTLCEYWNLCSANGEEEFSKAMIDYEGKKREG